MPSTSTQSEMCIRCAAECCDPFLHSVCFYFCHVPFCEEGRERRRGGGDAEEEDEWSRQIQECSLNVPWEETVTRSASVLIKTMYWIIHRSIIGVYFYIFCELKPCVCERRRIIFLCFLSPTPSSSFSFSSPGYFVQETNMLSSHATSRVRNQAFLHKGLWISGYSVYLQTLPFCILQRVSKRCVAMLLLLNLHWQAALMVFLCVCLAIPCVYGHWLYLMTSNWSGSDVNLSSFFLSVQ